MKTKLPKRTGAQKIGIKAQSLFREVFTEFCSVIPIPQEEDLGLDFDCQLIKKECPTGIHFKVQCKGTEEVDSDKENLRIQIKTRTANYWTLEKDSVFLIIVDDREKIFYWLDAKKFISKLKKWKNKRTITFSIPKKQTFDSFIKTIPVKMEEIIWETEISQKENLKNKDISRSEKVIIKELRILEDQIWYDRHQLLKGSVNSGRLKIDPKIWAGALKAEKEMKKKYKNRGLGPWNDIDWGIILGKVSALRWLFGDDWDNFDS